MIFVRDKGQMCNNILQYGHVYAWAKEHGRKCMSMRFAYKYQFFNICDTRYHNFPTYVLAKFAAWLKLLPVVSFNEKDAPPDDNERMMLSRHNILVEGWEVRFYDLFLKHKDEIICLFGFKDEIKKHISSLINKTSGKGSLRLGIHIRRGDYKKWFSGKYFFDDETFINYIKAFARSHADRKITVYICSNDPNLDKSVYVSHLTEMDVVFPAGNPGEDLCLLFSCDYLIGPPSTFTLGASMYHDVPLCWMEEKDPATMKFDVFDNLFRRIK